MPHLKLHYAKDTLGLYSFASRVHRDRWVKQRSSARSKATWKEAQGQEALPLTWIEGLRWRSPYGEIRM